MATYSREDFKRIAAADWSAFNILRKSNQGILCHKLPSNLATEAHLDFTGDIDLGQFLLLELRVLHESPEPHVRDRHVRYRIAN